MAAQLRMAGEAIVRMGWKWYRADGYEADDILATLARQALDGFGHIFIATNDHDLYGMVSRQVTVLAAGGKPPQKPAADGEQAPPKVKGGGYVHVTPEVVFEKMGVEPRQVADLRALVGDTSDGYPGCPGIGDKKAPGLLVEYGTLDGVYEHVDGLPDGVRAKLIAGEPLARLSRELATLATNAPVVIDPSAGRVGVFDHEAVKTYLEGYGLNSIIRRLGLADAEA
jgi:DNA polymerase-1